MSRRRVDSRRRHVGPGAQAGVLPVLPPGFVQAARTWLGHEADAFLEACARPPALAVRANALKGGWQALLRALGPGAEQWPAVPWWPDARLPPPGEAARLAADPGPAGPLGFPSIAAHSSYWQDGNVALRNFGAVIAGVLPSPQR